MWVLPLRTVKHKIFISDKTIHLIAPGYDYAICGTFFKAADEDVKKPHTCKTCIRLARKVDDNA